jgi:hypothetical protein
MTKTHFQQELSPRNLAVAYNDLFCRSLPRDSLVLLNLPKAERIVLGSCCHCCPRMNLNAVGTIWKMRTRMKKPMNQ